MATTYIGLSGHHEVKRVVNDNGSPTAIRASGWRGVACRPTDAGQNQGTLEGLSNEYYNTPGILAVVRRQFENACRRPGLDPATFATELGILAVRGFADMNEKARDLMIRNKFIAAQRSCELRRHLDGAAEEASIGNIVDSCRIWESHAETVFVGSVRQDPDGSQSMSQVTGGKSHFRRHRGQHGYIRTSGA